MMLAGNSLQHLDFFLDKLSNKEPFSFIRPNDGEYMIIKDDRFTNIDAWTFSGGALRTDLLTAIQGCAVVDNCYVGLPCKACWGGDMTAWCIENYKIRPGNLTYGNLVCNKNWKIFTDYMINKRVPLYYVGPGKEPSDKLNVVDRYYTDPFQIERWTSEKSTFLEGVHSWVKHHIDTATEPLVFAFSVGPLSKILISQLCAKYTTHFFMDIGSAFDIFLKGISNRGYITPSGPYSEIVCDFDTGHM